MPWFVNLEALGEEETCCAGAVGGWDGDGGVVEGALAWSWDGGNGEVGVGVGSGEAAGEGV